MFCPHCGKDSAEDQAYCGHCGGRISEPGPPPQQGMRETTPWEDRQTRGILTGVIDTLKSSLFSPAEFFRKMKVTGGLTDPLLYALITGMAGVMVSFVWQILLQDTLQSFVPQEMRSAAGLELFRNVGMAALAVMMPFMMMIGLFIWAGMLHLFLMMVKGANNGFEATFRTVAYSYGANVFQAIPFCGGFIATVWSLVLVIIGLRESHGTTGGKATFAALFPLVLCCVFVALVAVLIFGTIAASLGSMSR